MKLRNTSLRRVLLISTVLLISIALGTGVNKAFAGQGIGSLLTSWFDSKREASINQMNEAITSEKERLIGELREAIRLEMQRSDEELAQFTANETALRLSMLQDYATNLIGGLYIDLTAEKADIIVNLDAALAEAMAHLDSSIVVPPQVSIPNPSGEGSIPGEDGKKESSESDDSSETEDSKEDGTIGVDEEQVPEDENSIYDETEDESEIPLENAESIDEIQDAPEEDAINEEEENATDEALISKMVPTNL